MNKLYTIKIGILIFLAFLAASCEDYLSEIPDNRTEIDSPEKISELLVIAYPEANYMDFAETMSDNVSDKGNTLPTELNLANYRWEDIDIDDMTLRALILDEIMFFNPNWKKELKKQYKQKAKELKEMHQK